MRALWRGVRNCLSQENLLFKKLQSFSVCGQTAREDCGASRQRDCKKKGGNCRGAKVHQGLSERVRNVRTFVLLAQEEG